ncbi:MAG: helix-turn-helix transcriptional regulator [Chitinispirillaceae bacterium]|nr:helix-turn-helix transcriptional regulator [Chitinispirillaceae bacterium]
MIKRVLLYLPALFFLLPSFLPEKVLTILPAKGERRYRLETYVDYLDTTRGSLGTVARSNDSVIVFEYTLRMVNHTETIKPISGFTMIFDKHSKGAFLDVSAYDYLDIDISMKEATSFIIYLKTFEHFTDTTKWMTQRYSEKEVALQPRVTGYRLAFKEFATPNWWKSLIGPRFLTLPKAPYYSKVMALDFQNNPGGPLDVSERMEIRKIEFRKDRRLLYGGSIGGAVGWTLILSLLFFIGYRKNAGGSGAAKPIRHVALGNQSEEQLTRLVTFIGSNYQNPDLSVEIVGKDTGIGVPHISALLQQKHRMNFKQYLNDIRITEAKRLLRETDRTIAEIAFAVGYNSIPHFNRVFRDHTNTTPTEYRDNAKKSG